MFIISAEGGNDEQLSEAGIQLKYASGVAGHNRGESRDMFLPPSSPTGMSPATPDDILTPPLAGITIAIPAKTSQPVILAGRRGSSYGHAVTRSVTQPRRKPRYVFAAILADRNESGYARRHTYPAAGGNYHRHPCKNLPTRHPRRQAGIQLWTCRHAKRDTTAAKAAICFCRHPRLPRHSRRSCFVISAVGGVTNYRQGRRVVRRSRMDKPNNGETTNSCHPRRQE